MEVLEKEIARQQELVRKLQEQVGTLHTVLSGRSMDPMVSSSPGETVQTLQAQQIEARADFDRLSALYDYLRQLDKTQLKSAISTASPDPQLTDLMKQRDLGEQKLADQLDNVAPEHPDAKRITRVLSQINKQIEDRIEGIMRGLEVRREAEKARLDRMEKSLVLATQHHIENVLQSRPYQQLLQELRAQEEILQRLRIRMADERIDRALEESKRN